MSIAWNRNDADSHSGVSGETDVVYQLKRGDSSVPLWWVSEMVAGMLPRALTGISGLDTAKAFCAARDRDRQTGETW